MSATTLNNRKKESLSSSLKKISLIPHFLYTTIGLVGYSNLLSLEKLKAYMLNKAFF